MSTPSRAEYYPAFLDLQGQKVVVVGGGTVAAVKLAGLMPCGAKPLVVISPEIGDATREYVEREEVFWLRRPYREGDLRGAQIAFATTNNTELNARVAAEARELKVPLLCVDDMQHSDFIAPAITRRGSLTVAISTHGQSPAMARFIREWMDRSLPGHWGDLMRVAGEMRQRLKGEGRRLSQPEWQRAIAEAEGTLISPRETSIDQA